MKIFWIALAIFAIIAGFLSLNKQKINEKILERVKSREHIETLYKNKYCAITPEMGECKGWRVQ